VRLDGRKRERAGRPEVIVVPAIDQGAPPALRIVNDRDSDSLLREWPCAAEGTGGSPNKPTPQVVCELLAVAIASFWAFGQGLQAYRRKRARD
jgi:hypothetical protein